ncbi:MAG: hypothetical protein ABDH63_00915 [Candidatus Caldarchaeales archaeon]
MPFDVLPKTNREDIFGREKELSRVFLRSSYRRLILWGIGKGNHRWVEIKRAVET